VDIFACAERVVWLCSEDSSVGDDPTLLFFFLFFF
jgi:hypothetical protein